MRGDRVPQAWLPGAGRVHAVTDGGVPSGGAPRVVWHTTESDPRRTSAATAAWHLDDRGVPSHLVWNPLTAEVVQMIPATRAGRCLRDRDGGLGPNRQGRLCVQVAVVGFTEHPFTAGPLRGLAEILDWLDSWAVPRRWPAGEPTGAAGCHDGEWLRARWSRGGHFGHSQVPASAHPDPGALDITRLPG